MAEVYDSRAGMLEMPTEYKELSEEEKEYDGGWIWSVAISAVGWACSAIGRRTNNKALKTAGTIITAVGAISTGVGIGLGAVTIAKATTAISNKVAANFVYNSTMGVGDAVIGLGYSAKYP